MFSGTALNGLLYGVTVLIWGTTWYAIAMQVGEVPVMISIFTALPLRLSCYLAG